MKKFLLILFACAFLLPASALQPVGKLEVYATFRTPKQICEGGNKVFFLADNSLFSYGKNDKEIRELSRLNILSDNNIILIAKTARMLLERSETGLGFHPPYPHVHNVHTLC